MNVGRGTRGQALAEFGLVLPIFLLLIFGLIDVSGYFIAQNGITDGIRVAARFAATNPSAWSSSDPGASNTIQGAAQSVGAPTISTSTITLTYWDISGAGTAKCGTYAAGTFVLQPGYATQLACLRPLKTMIEISVTYTYHEFISLRMFQPAVTFTETTEALEER